MLNSVNIFLDIYLLLKETATLILNIINIVLKSKHKVKTEKLIKARVMAPTLQFGGIRT